MKEKSIIDEQYYLNENKIFEKIEQSKQYQLESKKAEEIEQLLKNCSSQDNQELITDCFNAHNDKSITMMRIAFKYGFSLANKLMIDSLRNN